MSALVKKPSQRIEMQGFYLLLKLQLIAYMAPMACTVANAEEYGFIFCLRFSKGDQLNQKVLALVPA